MAPNEPRMGRGSEGGHLFWFCHCGGTVQARSREGGGGVVHTHHLPGAKKVRLMGS